MSEQLPAGIREIAAAQVERLAAQVAALSDADLVAPTLCSGWLASHLLVHMRQGLVEHALSFAEPAGPGDVLDRDYVSYWQDFPAADILAMWTVEWVIHQLDLTAYLASERLAPVMGVIARFSWWPWVPRGQNPVGRVCHGAGIFRTRVPRGR